MCVCIGTHACARAHIRLRTYTHTNMCILKCLLGGIMVHVFFAYMAFPMTWVTTWLSLWPSVFLHHLHSGLKIHNENQHTQTNTQKTRRGSPGAILQSLTLMARHLNLNGETHMHEQAHSTHMDIWFDHYAVLQPWKHSAIFILPATTPMHGHTYACIHVRTRA